MTYINIYSILIILQCYSGEGGVTSYNSMEGGTDLKKLRTYDIYNIVYSLNPITRET